MWTAWGFIWVAAVTQVILKGCPAVFAGSSLGEESWTFSRTYGHGSQSPSTALEHLPAHLCALAQKKGKPSLLNRWLPSTFNQNQWVWAWLALCLGCLHQERWAHPDVWGFQKSCVRTDGVSLEQVSYIKWSHPPSIWIWASSYATCW